MKNGESRRCLPGTVPIGEFMKNTLAVMATATVLAACGGGGDASGTDSSSSVPAPPAGAFLVGYSVTGSTNSAALTYSTTSGGTAQELVTVPAHRQQYFNTGNFLYISAQNQNASGSITTTITVNGTPFKATTSSGPYVIATASGTCCQ